MAAISKDVLAIMKRMFNGVKRPWYDILCHESCKDDLIAIIEQLSKYEDNMTPKWEDVLTFAKFPFKNIRGVVVGQDPYPKRGDAHGLSFSSRAKTCPASVSRIFGALIESKLIPGKPASWDLSRWAQQGLVLMNASWTTEIGTANAHKDIWNAYTTKVFNLIAKHAPRPLMWMLWGTHAQAKCGHIAAPHECLTWCHPVASMGGELSFGKCPHFAQFSAKHPDFVWHFDPIKTRYYTDGSCKGNGRAGARGAWGVICQEGPHAGKSWGGALPAQTPIVSEGKDIMAYPTNIRAEGMALMNAFARILDIGIEGKHTICTDSQFWIDMIMTNMPKWVESKMPFSERKNSDISEQIWKLWNVASKLGTVLQYVQAHHDYEPTDTTRTDWSGNKSAEEIAEAHLPSSKR